MRKCVGGLGTTVVPVRDEWVGDSLGFFACVVCFACVGWRKEQEGILR